MPPPFTMLFTALLMFGVAAQVRDVVVVFARLLATFETLFETLFTFASSDCNWLRVLHPSAFRPRCHVRDTTLRTCLAHRHFAAGCRSCRDRRATDRRKAAVANVLEFATELEPSATEFAVVAERCRRSQLHPYPLPTNPPASSWRGST